MFNRRRGQVTIFIIVGIFIIAGVVIFFLINTNVVEEASKPGVQVEPIHTFVQECIDQHGAELIYNVGRGGGYYLSPELSTLSGVTYYYYEGLSYFPSMEQIENEISFFMNEFLYSCTKNFVDFPDFSVAQGEIKTQTKIQDESVILNINYPLTISKGEESFFLEDFDAEFKVRFGVVYNSVFEFMDDQVNSGSEGICLSCLVEISEKNDLRIEMVDYNEETTIFIFVDENSQLNDEDFAWFFANKYELA